MACVSVIIPTYNHAKFLPQSIGSVLEQTYSDIELIVVDDGSKDDTREVVSRFHEPICYVYQENQGLSASRNNGIRQSSGDYLMFLDADDSMSSRKLELQVQALNNHPEWGLVYSGWNYMDENGTKVIGTVRPKKQGQLLEEWLLRSFFFPPGAALVRRECFDTCGFFDENLRASEDTDFWVRLAYAGYLFGYIDDPLFNYRVVQGSMSSNNQNQMKHEFLRLDKFFARTDLTPEVLKLKDKAYAILMFEAAARFYLAADYQIAHNYLKNGIQTCPDLAKDKNWLLEWLAGVALDPRISNPEQLLGTIFDNLPAEAVELQRLRQKAIGRYHAAAAFSECHNHRYAAIRPHLLPAAFGDPSILNNRGFWRILLRSIFAQREYNRAE